MLCSPQSVTWSLILSGVGVSIYLNALVESVARVLTFFFFFFQAEDGIRDLTVTGVQTCALPISLLVGELRSRPHAVLGPSRPPPPGWSPQPCRHRDTRGLLARVHQRRVVSRLSKHADSGAPVLCLCVARAARLPRRRHRPGRRELRSADARVDPALRGGAARPGSGCRSPRVCAKHLPGGGGFGRMGAGAARALAGLAPSPRVTVARPR